MMWEPALNVAVTEAPVPIGPSTLDSQLSDLETSPSSGSIALARNVNGAPSSSPYGYSMPACAGARTVSAGARSTWPPAATAAAASTIPPDDTTPVRDATGLAVSSRR